MWNVRVQITQASPHMHSRCLSHLKCVDRSSCIWYISPLHIFMAGIFSEIGIYHPNLALSGLFRAFIE
jgi:hypothetical protein